MIRKNSQKHLFNRSKENKNKNKKGLACFSRKRESETCKIRRVFWGKASLLAKPPNSIREENGTLVLKYTPAGGEKGIQRKKKEGI